MKNPILFTTPRTGSTVVCKLLGNISKQLYGHKNVLYEYFNTLILDNDINSKYLVYKEVRIFDEWIIAPFTNPQPDTSVDVRASRLELLRNNPKHTIKLFPTDLSRDVLEFISTEYDFVFLERRNKVEQFLSFCSILDSRKTHHFLHEKGEIGQFQFKLEHLGWFTRQMHEYKNIRNSIPGIRIYYEDFMSLGGDQQALATLLGLVDTTFTGCDVLTKPTPYEDTYENLISNKAEWLEHKQNVINTLSKFN